jgi:hypothetical protein
MTTPAGGVCPISATTTIPGRPRQARLPWLRIFVVGYLLWVASVLVTFPAGKSASFARSSCFAASWSGTPSWSTPPGAPTWSARPDNVYPQLSSTVETDCGVVDSAVGRRPSAAR